MTRIVHLTLAMTLMALGSTAFAFGNPSRGQELSSQVCASCHGIDGKLALADDYPLLAGQHRSYLVFALQAYRSGDRDHAVMSAFAENLSDQDIEDLAAWFSRQDGLGELTFD